MSYNIISSLKENDPILHYFIIKESRYLLTRENKPYMDFILMDRTGIIPAKLWDCSELDRETFVANSLIKVKGIVRSWNNQLQITIERIRLTQEEDKIHISDLVPAAPMPPVDMMATVRQYAERIDHSEIRQIVLALLEENEERLLYYPAAKVYHHAFYAGLLYHMVSMLELGDAMLKKYPFLNSDLLIAGIILHDIAKLKEMEAEIGIATDYTVEGNLLGHLVLGAIMIQDAARKLGISGEAPVLLQHLVISHHGKREFGSPVEPMLPEAEMLHHLDMIDSRMNAIEKALAETKDEDLYTAQIRSLDYRKLYRPRLWENMDV